MRVFYLSPSSSPCPHPAPFLYERSLFLLKGYLFPFVPEAPLCNFMVNLKGNINLSERVSQHLLQFYVLTIHVIFAVMPHSH